MEPTSIESNAFVTPKDLKSATLAHLRRESLDVFNRLHSIVEDVKFVEYVHDAYPLLPILPNLRCGAWYVNPAIAEKWPAYFKSTDGHFSNWSFNLRRANLHLLSHLTESHGMVLVDSTRSGKRIPDALSKTVPIWCAVVNRAIRQLYPDVGSGWDVGLYTPPNSVSPQEHRQIETRLDDWARALVESTFEVPRLPHPLRPFWVTPATTSLPLLSIGADVAFIPIICLSASKVISEGLERRSGGFSYIQGSGDDHELWGMGLTPDLFWRHQSELLSAGRSELPSLVASLVSSGGLPGVKLPPSPIIKIGSRISLCALSDMWIGDDHNPRINASVVGVDYFSFIILEPEPRGSDCISSTSDNYLRIPVTEGKRGQIHFLEDVLPRSMDYIEAQMRLGKHICIACETGNDVSVGVAVAALQKFFDDEGKIRQSDNLTAQMVGDKSSIRTRLQWIIASRPQANPSRVTLKRVNEFLLSPSSFREKSTK